MVGFRTRTCCNPIALFVAYGVSFGFSLLAAFQVTNLQQQLEVDHQDEQSEVQLYARVVTFKDYLLRIFLTSTMLMPLFLTKM